MDLTIGVDRIVTSSISKRTTTMKPSEAEKHPYSWLVLFFSFLVRMLVFGALFSVGVLYVEWLDEFKASRGATAWVGSIATGTTLLMGKPNLFLYITS